MTDAGLMPLILQLGRTRAAAMDVSVALTTVCTALPSALGVAGAVILLAEPESTLIASDQRSGWIGDTQRRASLGPLVNALRTGRPLLTADLTRIGPPALAAASAECGLVSSLVMPIEVDGERVGALQLLADVHRPVDPALADAARPLIEVLAARLADVRALRAALLRAAAVPVDASAEPPATAPVAAAVPRQAGDVEVPTRALPSVPSQAAPYPTQPPVPAQRPATTLGPLPAHAPQPYPRSGRHSA